MYRYCSLGFVALAWEEEGCRVVTGAFLASGEVGERWAV
jgi:hypothetical protein